MTTDISAIATSGENMSLVVCDQLRLIPACSALEASQSLEILGIVSIGIIYYLLVSSK